MKAFLFDLDGTLLDSTDVWRQIDVDFLARRGLDVPPDYLEAIASRSFPESAAYTIARFRLPDRAEDLLREWNEMAAYAYGHTVPLKPYARDYLRALRSRGAKLAVVTSLPAALYEPALENHGIREWFDVLCSTDEVGCGKTWPDVFLLAASRLGAAPGDCVVFEDLLPAIRSAKGAGMTVYGVYDEASKAHWPEVRRVADGALRDFRDGPLLEPCEHSPSI